MADQETNNTDASASINLDEIDLTNKIDILTSTSKYIHMDEIETITNHNDKYISIHLNIQSLPSKFDELNNTLRHFGKNGQNIDFIMLCETFLTDTNEHLYKIPGYTLITQNRKIRQRGGIAIYINEKHNVFCKKDVGINIEGIFESLFVEVDTPDKTKLIIGEIYRVPGTNEADSLTYFEQTINSLSSYKEIVIGTDQNFDYLKYDSHKPSMDLLQLFITNGLMPTITKPTRVTHSTATLIDNIYLSTRLKENSTSAILCSDISDHFLVFTVTKKQTKNKMKQPLIFKHRPINLTQINEINNALEHTNWEFTLNTQPDEAYNMFIKQVNETIDKFAPEKVCLISGNKVRLMPWFTSGLQTSSHTLSKLYRKSLGKDKTHINFIKYKSYRNIYNQLKRYAKQHYYEEQLTKYKDNIKMTWKTINGIIGKHNNAKSIPDHFPHKSETELANEFCTYFQAIGPTLANEIPTGKKSFSEYMANPNNKNLFITPTDKYEILKLISSLKNTKSSGQENINSLMLKKIKESVAYPIANLINNSISSGSVPHALKIAKVIPIYKSGDHSDFGNYRPISILPVISKLYEKVMYKRLYSFLTTNNILNKSQYGFRSKHSTIHAVTELIENILDGYENKESTLSVFVDLSKAFDTINHDILLNKLCHYGVRGQALEWFKSYLLNRKQYVSLGAEYKSQILPIECGVPQGSILGPLLFIIYTNDIPSCLKQSHPILFADDTNISLKGQNAVLLYQTMNAELEILGDWYKANKLSLNVKKTNYVFFPCNKLHAEYICDIIINNAIINQKQYVTFLGILMDAALSWDNHISKLATKLTSALYALRSAKNYLTEKALKTIYYALFQSHIDYGLILWGTAAKKHINRIWILQKKAIRILTKATYNAHTNPLFHKLRILKLWDIYKVQQAKFMHKMYRKALPDPLNYILVLNSQIHDHFTRNRINPRRPLLKSSKASRGIYYNSSILWCNLDPEFKDIPEYSVFSRKLKKHFLHQYITDI